VAVELPLEVVGDRLGRPPGCLQGRRGDDVHLDAAENLVRRPGFAVWKLLKTRLGPLESRKHIREWLSRIRNSGKPANHAEILSAS